MRRLYALAVLPFLAMIALPVLALENQGPTLNVQDARAYRNVAEVGDLLVLWQYGLPETTWATYGRDAALATLSQTGSTLQQRIPPEIGQSLGAFYLEPGHSFVWGTGATVRLEQSPSLFATTTPSTITISQVATTAVIATSTDDQTILCDDVTEMLISIEQADEDSIDDRDYMNANAITSAGTSVALAAFGAFAAVLPNCFAVGIETAPDITPGDPVGRDNLISQVEGSSIWPYLGGVATSFGFTQTELFITLVGLLFSFVVLTLVVAYSGSAQFGAAVAAVFALGFALNAPHWLYQGIIVASIFAQVGAASYWLRNVPR